MNTSQADPDTLLQERQSCPELSIIFVNWNSLRYLEESLTSIYNTTAGVSFEVIIVDNASSGDDLSQLEEQFPSVQTLISGTNLGFAAANNLGFQHSSGKYLLFLNPDTRVIGSAIATMLHHLRSLPDAVVVGCKLLNADGSVQTSCIQRFPTIWNQVLDFEFLRSRWPGWRIWGIAPLFSESSSCVEVEVVSGACLMVERCAFQQAGMFSDQYFMYAEDVDLCYQLRQLGRKTYYVGDAVVLHYGGGTSKPHKGDQWVAIMQRRSILKFCRNAHGGFYAGAYRIAMGISAACRLAVVALIVPFKRVFSEKQLINVTFEKWVAVLCWAIGLKSSGTELYKDCVR